MDFSGATKAVGKTAFRACLRRSRGLATRATLARLVRDDGELLTLLTKNCPKLDHLEIRNSFTGGSLVRAAPFAKNLTSILISEAGRVTMDTVEVLLETCATNHRRMDWPKPLSNLKRLWLLANRDGLLPGLNLAGLFAMAPNIQDLVVADWQQASWYWETIPFPMLSGLTRLTLRNTSILHFPPLPLSIRHLELSDLGTMKFEDNSRENIATATLCNLEGLSLNKIAHFPAADLLVLLAPSTGKLQRLRISDCANITGADIAYLASAGAMSSVHDLALCGLDLDDDCIELLAPRAPQLTRLDLASTRVSGIAVRALVARKEARPIEWLGLDGCAGVGADAVELARAAGVVVQHSLEKGRAKGTKGTKVRLA
ncbi:MAG: hypothetical protein M1832_001003 [Thelocarpon impressellum]|nr:MAG: hypothetical protein M1832_001003 [Thelocarpon impressellum]